MFHEYVLSLLHVVKTATTAKCWGLYKLVSQNIYKIYMKTLFFIHLVFSVKKSEWCMKQVWYLKETSAWTQLIKRMDRIKKTY